MTGNVRFEVFHKPQKSWKYGTQKQLKPWPNNNMYVINI